MENACACGGAKVPVAQAQSGMVSSVAALAWAPVADPKQGGWDWDFEKAKYRGVASLASTVLQEMHHDADCNPATPLVVPWAWQGGSVASPALCGNALCTGSAGDRTTSRPCRIVDGACSMAGSVLQR